MPKWNIPFFLWNIICGRIEKSKFVEIIKIEKMEIISDNQIIHLDGEVKLINGNIFIENISKSLKILIPDE